MIPNLYIGNGWKSPFPSIFKWLFGVPGSSPKCCLAPRGFRKPSPVEKRRFFARCSPHKPTRAIHRRSVLLDKQLLLRSKILEARNNLNTHCTCKVQEITSGLWMKWNGSVGRVIRRGVQVEQKDSVRWGEVEIDPTKSAVYHFVVGFHGFPTPHLG